MDISNLELAEVVKAIADGDLTAPFPRCGAILRKAFKKKYVSETATRAGLPLSVTASGMAFLRKMRREHG